MCIPPYQIENISRYYQSQGVKPYTIDNQKIIISAQFYSKVEDSIREAMESFPPKSFAIHERFREGIIFFCFKDEYGFVASCSVPYNWPAGSPEEIKNGTRIELIKSDPMCKQIEVTVQMGMNITQNKANLQKTT